MKFLGEYREHVAIGIKFFLIFVGFGIMVLMFKYGNALKSKCEKESCQEIKHVDSP